MYVDREPKITNSQVSTHAATFRILEKKEKQNRGIHFYVIYGTSSIYFLPLLFPADPLLPYFILL